MIIINVDKNNMQVLSNETITSGSINAYTCKFTFSDDWEGLTKSAVFRAGDKYIECLLADDDTVSVPWECMTTAGVELFVGLRGVAGEETETKDDDILLPSVWCLIGTVRKGTTAGEEPEPPTPSAWEQILMKINSLEENKQNVLTAGDNISISYDNVISASAYDDTELRASVGANTEEIYKNAADIAANAEAISGLETSKQDTLTAGANITISPEGVISAVVGASYDDTEIRAELSDVKNSVNTNTSAISANAEAIAVLETSKQDTLTAGANITISPDGVISAVGGASYDDTKVKADIAANSAAIAANSSAISANAEAISGLETSKQDALTAGDNITISPEGVISAVVGESYDDTEIRAEISDVKNSVNTNTSAISANAEAISGLETSKQNKLTAGDNITISPEGLISAKDELYDDTEIRAEISDVKNSVNANTSAISANTEEIARLKTSKQNKLSAGANISISADNVISSAMYDDTSIRSQIDNISARVDSNSDSIVTNANNIASLRGSIMTKQDELTAGANITISENNVISAASYNDTELRNLIANKQDALTAGDNITINNNVISSAMYDDTQIQASVLSNFNSIQTLKTGKQDVLTAGTNITIENNVISATGGASDDKMDKVNPTGSGILTILGGSSAVGNGCTSSGVYAHAEGNSCTASGDYSHSEGNGCTASGPVSHAEGESCTASGYSSHAGGEGATSRHNHAIAYGYHISTTNDNQACFGRYNKGYASITSTKDFLIIGNGDGPNAWVTGGAQDSNAFRVTEKGATYAQGAYSSSGADYAEYVYEWEDGNTENEDRRGYFVTVRNKKLRKAEAGDYVVGITSGNPSVIGNGDEDWRGRWLRDEFGSVVYKDVEVNDYAEDGETITGTHIEHVRQQSKDYDSSQEYIERKDRPEWSCVGMIGVLYVRDDGTCIPGDFCKCGNGGVATYTSERGFDTFFVLERTDDNIIKVQLR